MAQSVPFTFWSADQAPGYAGMKADSTVDVIDSYPVATAGIEAGVPVMRGSDPTTVELADDADKVIGISVHTHKIEETPYYPVGYTAPICTFGDVWVKVAAAVDAGDAVYIDEATGEFTDSTGTAVAGMTYLTAAGADELAVVRVRL